MADALSGSAKRGAAAVFVGLMAIGLALSIMVAWVAASYFRIDVAGSLVWPGSDGFCDVATQGLGVHCFSDLSLHLGVGRSLVPDDAGLVQYTSNLPPGGRVLLWVFQVLASFTGFRATFAVYMILSAAALLVPALWAVRGRSWQHASVIVVLTSVATVPFLAVLDRGNTIAFAIPLIFLFVIALSREYDMVAITSVVVAAQIKPQFGLLVIGFLVLRRWRAGLIAVAASVFVFLGSFLVFAIPGAGSSPLEEFKRFVLYSQFRGNYVPVESSYPINISFQRVVYEIGDRFFGVPLTSFALQLVTLFIVGLVLAALVWRGRRLPYPVWISVILMSSALVVSVTFIYYFSLVLVTASLLVRPEGPSVGQFRVRPLESLLVAATFISLTPLLIPGGWADAPLPTVGDGVVVSLLPSFASGTWLVLVVTTGVAAVRARAVID